MNTFEQSLIYHPKATVLGVPVGLDIYYFNPFRVCNISPGRDWDKAKKNLQTKYLRFLSLAKINRLEKPPIGPGKDVLLNPIFRHELEKNKTRLNKPNERIVWKIFWLNHLEDHYKNIPINLEKAKQAELSNHSKAVVSHFLAINHTLDLIEGKEKTLNKSLWEDALIYWEKTLEDESFWIELEEIIRLEIDKGYYELQEYDNNTLKKEITKAIYQSLVSVPLKLIEEGVDIADKNEWLSNFLSLILRSPLGDDEIRFSFVKKLAENRISKDVVRDFASANFRTWAMQGTYKRLYTEGMAFLDAIHSSSLALTQELETYNTFTSSAIGFEKTPELHSRAIGPLFEAIRASQIFNEKNTSREIKDRTVFTFLILCLRMLSEFGLDSHMQLLIIEEIDWMNRRFSFDKLTAKERSSLNLAAWKTQDIQNENIASRYYLAQYCYFIEGEFADPSAAFVKSFKKEQTSFTQTIYSIIPRSQMAKNVHDRKISPEQALAKRRLATQQIDLKSRTKTLKLEISSLKAQIVAKEKALKKYKVQEREAEDKASTEMQMLANRIKNKEKELRETKDFKDQDTAISQKLDKITQEKENLGTELMSGINAITRKIRQFRYLQLIASLLILGGLFGIFSWNVYGGIVIGVIGVIAVSNLGSKVAENYSIRNSLCTELDNKLESLQHEKDQVIALHVQLLADIESAAKGVFGGEIMKIEKQKNISLNQITRASSGLRKEYNQLKNLISKNKKELKAVQNAAKKKPALRPTQHKHNHPVIGHLKAA